MNVENNHTAETEGEQTTNGSETITIQSTLGDEGWIIYTQKSPKLLSNILLCLGLAQFLPMKYANS